MNRDGRSDAELLSAYVEHSDASAFEGLYRKYVALVHSVCLRYLRVPQDAEDATAACFIVLSRKAVTIKDRSKIMTWLYSCAVATARNAKRILVRRAEREKAAYDAGVLAREGANSNWDAVLPLIESEIARLPGDLRETVILHFYQGLSRPELAERMSCSEGTVANRLFRAMQKLRQKLGACGQQINEDAIVSGMTGTALLVPVPESLMTKLSGMTNGCLDVGPSVEYADATIRDMFWGKLKAYGSIAAGVLFVGGAVAVGFAQTAGDEARETKPERNVAAAVSVPVSEAKPAPVNLHKGMQEREEIFDFAQRPTTTKEGDKVVIAFASKGKCDATVAIVGPEGRIVRHLASGVLGGNAPYPFQQNSLSQKLEWDGRTDNFQPAPTGCSVRVSLGLKAAYECDIAWDPRKDTYLEKDGKYFRTLYPPPADTPEDKLKECGLRPTTTIWGDRTFIGNKYGPFAEPTGDAKTPPLQKCVSVLSPVLGDKAPPRKLEFPPAQLPLNKSKDGWYDRNPRLAVDPATEELYVRGPGDNTIFRFNGKTGKFDESWFPKGEFNQVSEIDVGTDGLIYVRSSLHAYGRWLFRMDRTGKPVDFPKGEIIPSGDRQVPMALAKQQIKGMYTGVRGHSNIHQKGFDVTADGRIVTIIGEVDAKWAAAQGVGKDMAVKFDEIPGYYVAVWDNDGRLITANAVPGMNLGHGVRMDREGNIYLCQAYYLPASQKGLDGIPDDMSKLLSKEWGLWGGPGTLMKFRGMGDKSPVGQIYSGKDLSSAPADAFKLRDYRQDKTIAAASGALWAYGGIVNQGRSCSCNHGRYDMDNFARSWIPANQVASVMVLDSNGNRIARIGRYGNVDDEGIRFAWVRAVAVSDSALYAMDWDNRRVLKATLSYSREETAPVP
ncbi:MAG: hypothetical protein C0404_07950 [Verrucomicrobia bacterium]|nr:hypothetical protein [Verrucomicrobiota bacterium]